MNLRRTFSMRLLLPACLALLACGSGAGPGNPGTGGSASGGSTDAAAEAAGPEE